MGTQPPSPPLGPRFSPDGLWFWDGSEWKAAISPDRRWRWNGAAWVQFEAPRPAGSNAGVVAGVVAGGIAVVAIVAFIVFIVLLTMGNQIQNVFDNVVTALGS